MIAEEAYQQTENKNQNKEKSMATEMKIRRMSDVQLQEVAWLWKPYIRRHDFSAKDSRQNGACFFYKTIYFCGDTVQVAVWKMRTASTVMSSFAVPP